MKNILMVLSLFIVVAFVASCAPTEPREMLPYCQTEYEELLQTDPNFPHAFIGYCVAMMQTDKYVAYQPLCNYEPVWEMIEEAYEGVSITSKSECFQFFKSLDE